MSPRMLILFEHAAGYALFNVKEFEEIGMVLSQVESSITDIAKFRNVVRLLAFAPFKTAANALDNLNNISEGILHEDLSVFLETNLPKKKKVVLGVSDSKLGAAITEVHPIQCQNTGVVPELLRGIRHHFPKLVQGFSDQSARKAQLGLGHSYSRAKVKFNVNRVDNMIIQSICLLDQLDKDINTFAMRIREWYSYHFPELIKITPDNYMYAQLVKLIKNRKDLTPDHVEQLEEIVMDSAKASAIYEASKSSMGMDISPVDLINIETFASRVVALSEYRKRLSEYLKSKMTVVAPNLATLIGEQVGARLISRAGSLTNLAKFPASTVQILGAEKALFRALKTRSNTPKYGLIFHSSFISRADARNKGRISRYLANKCSIASRIDCFLERPTSVFGEKLRDQVEERLKFYETGEIPRKNVEVMQEAIVEVKKRRKEQKKQKKKRKLEEENSLSHSQFEDLENSLNKTQDSVLENSISKKKKKKKNKRANADLSINGMNCD